MSEDAPGTSEKKPKKPYKKKNFLKNARKYAKKGQLGRGTSISEEMYQYFVGILEAIQRGIEDRDERQALVNNVLERTKGEEIQIIGNQLGCRVIEILLPFSSPEDLERFMEGISPDLRRLCSDKFTSHVVETVLRVACDRATKHLQEIKQADVSQSEDEAPKKKRKKKNEKEELEGNKIKTESDSTYSKEHITKCHDFTLKVCKYALNNLEDFVWDPFANFILRTVLKCLSGITLLPGEKPKKNYFVEPEKDTKGIPPIITKLDYKAVPDEFKEIVKDFANRISSWPQFKDLPYKNLTSGFLQVLLYAIKNADKNTTRDLLKKLLNESFAPDDWMNNGEETDDKKDVKCDGEDVKDEPKAEGDGKNNLPPVFQTESAVRLLEAALFVAKQKMYTQIYAKCFINRLAQLACVKMLNFTVQRLIDNCHVKEELEPMLDELSDTYSALLACGNTGVLVAAAKACLRVQARQAHFVAKLESALNCTSPDQQKYFSICVLRLLPLDRIDVTQLDKNYFINVHGSVILQTILDFQRPAKAVSGLLELTPEQLLVILCDAKGCHVADAFCKGQCVGVKARDKLIWKLKGYYQKLALSQYGSRAFEQIFNAATPEQRVKIMTEISEKSNLLQSTPYGALLATILDVAGFKSSQKQWEDKWEKKMVKIKKNK